MSDLAPIRTYYETRELCHKDVYKHLAKLRKSLVDLKLASKKALMDNTLYWQNEIEKVKLQKDQEWQEKIRETETENKQLRAMIKHFEETDQFKKSASEAVSLWRAENQVDQLSRQLDKKLIHINKLQLALAEQSKAMFELEKSYVLLYRQYMKMHRKEDCKTELKSVKS